jgi:hypothetical protein
MNIDLQPIQWTNKKMIKSEQISPFLYAMWGNVQNVCCSGLPVYMYVTLNVKMYRYVFPGDAVVVIVW